MTKKNKLITELKIPGTEQELKNLAKINVILGKNGCGKSTILREIDLAFESRQLKGMVKYITPERGGSLTYDGNIETNISANPVWLGSIRRQNRSDNFKQVSAGEFRRLETLVLRKIEQNKDVRLDTDFTFDTTIKDINSLLDNVRIERADDAGFRVVNKSDSEHRGQLDTLSSGESELLSLSIEILSFIYQVKARNEPEKLNILLLDEPDVHLHPDLQERLIKLIYSSVADYPIMVIIATHSTAILSALSVFPDVSVGFMVKKGETVLFKSVSAIMRSVLPIFGAHPLSNIFTKKPILIVEGEDDERIWQTAVRSSQNRIQVWPCVAGDIQSLNAYEDEVEAISRAIYDEPIAYSLRDRDDGPYEIENKSIVKRMRLNCRTAENLLLTDDVLRGLGMDWISLQHSIEKWIADNPDHKQTAAMINFKEKGFDRRNADVKQLRNLFMERAGSQKPWEVAIGQTIAKLAKTAERIAEHSLRDYLGPKLIEAFGLVEPPKPSPAKFAVKTPNALPPE